MDSREVKRVSDAAEHAKREGKPGDMDKLEMIMALDGKVWLARDMAIHTLVEWEQKGHVKSVEVDDLVEESLKKIHGTDSVGSVTAYAMHAKTFEVLNDEKRKRIFKPIHQDKVLVGLSNSQKKEIAELRHDDTFEDEVFIGCIAASRKRIDPSDRKILLEAFPSAKSGDLYRDRFRRLMVKVIEAKSRMK